MITVILILLDRITAGQSNRDGVIAIKLISAVSADPAIDRLLCPASLATALTRRIRHLHESFRAEAVQQQSTATSPTYGYLPRPSVCTSGHIFRT
jgi:hypothetical protein